MTASLPFHEANLRLNSRDCQAWKLKKLNIFMYVWKRAGLEVYAAAKLVGG
jgi:hypothetical protein